MPHVRLVQDHEATGLLARLFEAACERAGRVYNIVRTMSLNAPVLEASMKLYIAIMKGPSALTRAQREMLATVTSKANACHY